MPGTKVGLLLLFIILVAPRLSEARANTTGNCTKLTPPTFNSTFIENCRNQQGTTEDQCNRAYSAFLGAFNGQDQGSLTEENYVGYFEVLPITAGQDQSLFWSKMFLVVRELSMRNKVKIVSSETTASGSIINEFNIPGLCWCSALNHSGLVLDRLCPVATTNLFWGQFSVTFAEAAKGTIFFLANGEFDPTYDPESFFGCYELENLTPNVVNKLVVLNAHRSNKGEACNTGSLNTLKDDAISKNLTYTCYDLHIKDEVDHSTDAIATCVEIVIEGVQNGMPPENPVLQCNGVKNLQISVFFLVAIIIASLSRL